MAKALSVTAKFDLANEVSPMGRRILQLSRMRRGQRSYQLADEFFALVGLSRAIVDGMALEKGLVRAVKHRDHTKSYVLTTKGKQAAEHIKRHIGA